jgi:hypothetical protein
MKIFVSWSGDLSRQLAESLREWLPKALQYVKPYFTPSDTEKGSRWETEIIENLKTSKVCVIALTRESLDSNWVTFEAGAISSNHDKARICAILFDVRPVEVTGPLVHFQATEYSMDEIRKLLTTINNQADEDKRLDSKALDESFRVWWPELEQKIDQILKGYAPASPQHRTERELLEEVVETVRSVQADQRQLSAAVNSLSHLRVPVLSLETVSTAAALSAGSSVAFFPKAGAAPITNPGLLGPIVGGSSDANPTISKPKEE